MQAVKDPRATAAIILAIAALVSNLLLSTVWGVPLSIPCGIMGIACAITTMENRKLPKKSKVAIILAVIGLVFGILIAALYSMIYKTMADPEASHRFLELLEEMLPQMPQSLQDAVREMYKL